MNTSDGLDKLPRPTRINSSWASASHVVKIHGVRGKDGDNGWITKGRVKRLRRGDNDRDLGSKWGDRDHGR